MDKQVLQLTRAEYTTAKANRTLVCPNLCKITDENNHTEKLMNNPKADIGIATYESGQIKFYSAEEYAALAVKPTVLGDYMLTEEKIILIHPEVNASVKWSGSTPLTVPGCYPDYPDHPSSYLLDMKGPENSAAVLAAVEDGLIANAPAFTWASQRVWADGYTGGYVLAAGEQEIARLNAIALNQCRSLHNADPIFASGKWYWSSSQNGANYSYYCQLSSWGNYGKDGTICCLAARAL